MLCRKKLNDTENNLAAERRKVQTNVQHLSQQNRIVGRLEGELQVAKQRADEVITTIRGLDSFTNASKACFESRVEFQLLLVKSIVKTNCIRKACMNILHSSFDVCVGLPVQAAKEADKWSEKVKEMMVKKVDLAEHEKTLEALKEAKQQLIDADKAAKERLAEVETSASKKTSEKVAEVEGTSKQRIADLESKLEQASQDLTKAKDDHAEVYQILFANSSSGVCKRMRHESDCCMHRDSF